MFILLSKKQMSSHCPLQDLWLSLQTELLAGCGRERGDDMYFPTKCIPTRKVVKECDCIKPSLYICHGNSSFKIHSDGRNINYHFSLISAECSYRKLAKSRLLVMQLDRPSSLLAGWLWVISGCYFWNVLGILYHIQEIWGMKWKGWKRLSPHSEVTFTSFFCEASSSLHAYFIHTFACFFTSQQRHTV